MMDTSGTITLVLSPLVSYYHIACFCFVFVCLLMLLFVCFLWGLFVFKKLQFHSVNFKTCKDNHLDKYFNSEA